MKDSKTKKAENTTNKLTVCCQYNKFFHVNESYEPVYEERYDWVGNFHDGRARAQKGNESFYIDTNGKRIGE